MTRVAVGHFEPDRPVTFTGFCKSNCSMLEAIDICQEVTGKEMKFSYSENNRSGDHIWYISDLSKFKHRYPTWSLRYDVTQILREIFHFNEERWINAK